jgi:hypothetical protein
MSGATRVWVPHLNDPVPTYHRWDTQPKDGVYRSLCGLLVWDRESNPKVQGIYLRTDHAQKIGRPCIRCFPEAVPA